MFSSEFCQVQVIILPLSESKNASFRLCQASFIVYQHFELIEFASLVQLTTCTVKEDADGRSRGYGFVNFEDPALVDQVMAQQEHVIDGRKVRQRRLGFQDFLLLCAPFSRTKLTPHFRSMYRKGVTCKLSDILHQSYQFQQHRDCSLGFCMPGCQAFLCLKAHSEVTPSGS